MQPDELATIHVLRVARAVLPPTDCGGLWPCRFCERDYPVHEGWLVDYYSPPTRETARAYVCEQCAALATDHLDGNRRRA